MALSSGARIGMRAFLYGACRACFSDNSMLNSLESITFMHFDRFNQNAS